MTIEQMVTIPADHLLHLDFEIPSQIPAGTTARLELFWSPQKEAVNSLDAALEKIWALCKDSSITVDSFLEMRRRIYPVPTGHRPAHTKNPPSAFSCRHQHSGRF
ncbi:MAG: hypothetical protein LBB89_05220 [Treponema sp.]|nr:hypothetical protein [Treponema sp.]